MAFSTNKPFIIPYNKEPTIKDLMEKLSSFGKQIFFFEARLKELENAYLDLVDNDDSGEDMESQDGSDDDLVGMNTEDEKKKQKK